MANRPYTKDMRQEQRETMPPSAEEKSAVARFEKSVKEEGDFWAVARKAADALGLKVRT